MQLSVKNFTTELSKQLLKQAGNNKVRECDETQKGHFVAYVDDKDKSFDTSLTIASKGEITSYSCECKQASKFCQHVTALLLHVTKGSKTKSAVKGKENKLIALIENADVNDLKVWITDLLVKHKDIALSFEHYFTSKSRQYNPEEIINVTNEAVKSVIKSKRIIDLTQLKKIVELWSELHKPILEYYKENPALEQAFINLHTIPESCLAVLRRIQTTGKKIEKYIETILQSVVAPINDIVEEESWIKAAGFFVTHIVDTKEKSTRLHYLSQVANLVTVSNEERKNVLIDLLANQYKTHPSNRYTGFIDYTKNVFNIIKDSALINKHYKIFQPLHYENDFNISLFQVFVDNKQYDLAIKYCNAQILLNHRQEFSIPYLNILKKIYTLREDKSRLGQVLTELLPYTYNFDDYLFVHELITDDIQKKNFRTKMLGRSRHAAQYQLKAALFTFKLMDHEKKHKKLFDYIDSSTPWILIRDYFDVLVTTDKKLLIEKIFNRSDNWYGFGQTTKNDKEAFPGLLEKLREHFFDDYLKNQLKKDTNRNFYNRGNSFLRYMENILLNKIAEDDDKEEDDDF